MMLFCMKGMFTGNKESKGHQTQTQQTDLQALQIKMADLIEQNHKLTQDLESLKNKPSQDSNVIQLKKA